MEYSGNPQMDLSLCCMHGYLTINYDCHSYPWKLFWVLLFKGKVLLWTRLALSGSWVLGTELGLFKGTQEFLEAPYEATKRS